MKRGVVLFFVGAASVAFSASTSLSILFEWVFSGFPEGSMLLLNSFVTANLLIGVVGVVAGIAGGFLIGISWREFRKALA